MRKKPYRLSWTGGIIQGRPARLCGASGMALLVALGWVSEGNSFEPDPIAITGTDEQVAA